MAAVQESLRSGKPYQVHYRLAPHSEKDERWVEAMAVVLVENSVAVRMLGTCRDVTDRQRLLRELRVRARQQEAVARLGELALTESDLQKLFDEIASAIRRARQPLLPGPPAPAPTPEPEPEEQEEKEEPEWPRVLSLSACTSCRVCSSV